MMLKKCNVFLLIFVALLKWSSGAELIKQARNTTAHDHEEHHEFEELVEVSNSQLSEKLDLASLKAVLALLNEQCLTAENVFQAVGVSVQDGLTADQFINASSIIAYHLQLSNTSSACNPSDLILDGNAARDAIFTTTEICQQQVSYLITNISANGKYVQSENAQECFGVADLIHECTSDSHEIDEALMKMISNMARGLCLLPTVDFFQDELFEYLNPDSNGHVTKEGFETLLTKFNLGGEQGDAHADEHAHEARRRRKRSSEDEEHHQRCYSTDQFLSIAGRDTNAQESVVLTKTGLLNICPAIIHQFVIAACAETSGNTASDSGYTTAQKYGYATVAVFLISLLAFGGLLLFPAMGTTSYKMTMQFFIALGIGTLSGDSLLHIIPEVVGLHDHTETGGEHAHDEEAENNTYIYRLLVVVVGIYIFYLFENVLRLYHQSKLPIHHHDSVKGNLQATQEEPTVAWGQHVMAGISVPNVESNELPGHPPIDAIKKHDDSSGKNIDKPVCCGATSVGVMVLVGDILHNFGDGLAIGVAFSVGWVSGVGTSIAILCHELPHEFGDFAIYMKNGMSKWKALFFNFLAACCAFIGLYIGLSLSENPEAREWMLAVIAGMFLYIALVDVLHEMIADISVDHPFLQFFLQNFGLWLGWIIMLLLALYEDRIRTAINA